MKFIVEALGVNQRWNPCGDWHKKIDDARKDLELHDERWPQEKHRIVCYEIVALQNSKRLK